MLANTVEQGNVTIMLANTVEQGNVTIMLANTVEQGNVTIMLANTVEQGNASQHRVPEKLDEILNPQPPYFLRQFVYQLSHQASSTGWVDTQYIRQYIRMSMCIYFLLLCSGQPV